MSRTTRIRVTGIAALAFVALPFLPPFRGATQASALPSGASLALEDASRAAAGDRLALPAGQGLTQTTPLVRIYHDILDARFEQAEEQLKQGCGGAPPVACDILANVDTWWRIQMDPASTALDARMRSGLEQAIAAADAWTRREPQRGEPWFYLG